MISAQFNTPTAADNIILLYTERLGIKIKSAPVVLAHTIEFEFAVSKPLDDVETLRASAANALKEKIASITTAVSGIIEDDRGQTALGLQQAQHHSVEAVRVRVAKRSFSQTRFTGLPGMAVVCKLLGGDTVLRGDGCE